MTGETPKSIKASVYIDGKPSESTLKQLRQETQGLRRDLDLLVPGTAAFNAKLKELQTGEKTLQRIRDEVKGVGGAFGWLKTEVGKFGALAAGYLGFQFITDSFQNIIVNNAKLSDSLADVRKTTGLSEDGVRRLSDELKKIDTRTSRAELLGLAEIAGKLGISDEEDVLGFVRAADKISVALGKDLGNTEEAVNSLGKLTELFKIKDAYGLEDALIRTGSAINALSADGTSNEGYLVEFTKRMGGVATAANFNIESILGLAATMDELGQPIEASTTAISQFVLGMGKDIPGFAKIAGMSVKEFSAILKTDGNQALLEVLKNLKSTGQGVGGLAEKMGLVGADGARAVAAIGALSNNLDLLVTRQKLSNDEFAKGTSLQNEFNIKNATFGAVLDRTGKQFAGFASNRVVTEFLKGLVINFSELLGWIEKNIVVIVTITKLVASGVTAWLGYRAALLVVSQGTAAFTLATELAKSAQIAFAGAQALLTGNLGRAQAAMRALNITMSANPIGAVIAVVAALTTAFILFSNKVDTAAKSQEDFNNIEAEAKKQTNEQIQQIKALKSVIESETASRQQKLIALQKLRDISPDILKGLTDEAALTNLGTVAINKYIKALETKTKAEAAQAQISKIQQENIDLEASDGTRGSFMNEGFQKLYKAVGYDAGVARLKGNNQAINKETIAQNDARIKAIQEKYGAEIVKNMLSTDVTTGGSATGGLGAGKADKSAKGKLDKANKDLAAIMEQYRKLATEAEKLTMGELEQKLFDIDLKYKKVIDQLRKYGKNAEADLLTNFLGSEKDNAKSDFAIKEKKRLSEEDEKQFQDSEKFINEGYGRQKDFQQNNMLGELDSTSEEGQRLAIKQQYKDQEYALEQERLTALKLLYESHGKDALTVDQQITAFRQAHAEEEYQQQQRNAQSKLAIENAYLDNIQQGTEALRGFLNKRSVAYKALLIAERAAKIAQIVMNTQAEIAGYYAAYSAIPFVGPGIASGLATAAKIRAGIGIATIVGQTIAELSSNGDSSTPSDNSSTPTIPQGRSYAKGGYVSNATIFNKGTGNAYQAGEAGKEWVAPSWMVQSPSFANTISMLEASRANRTSGYAQQQTQAASQADNSRMEMLMLEMIDAQLAANDKKLIFSHRAFEESNDQRVQIRNDVNA